MPPAEGLAEGAAESSSHEALLAELERKKEELASTQESFDEFVASSRELEQELEEELRQAQVQLSASNSKSAELIDKVEILQSSLRSKDHELSATQAECAKLKESLHEADKESRRLEQSVDDADRAARQAEAAVEDLSHRLERALEAKVFAETDLEEARLEAMEAEQRLRGELTEMKQELERLQAGLSLPFVEAQSACAAEPAVAPCSPASDSESPEELVLALEEEVQLLSQQLQLAVQRADGEASRAENLQQTADALSLEYSELQDQLRNKEASPSTLGTKIKELEELVEDLRGNINELESSGVSLREALSDLDAKLQDALVELKERDQKIVDIANSSDVLSKKLQERSDQLEEARQQISQLESNAAAAEEEFNTLREELANIRENAAVTDNEEDMDDSPPESEDGSGDGGLGLLRQRVKQLEQALEREQERSRVAATSTPLPARRTQESSRAPCLEEADQTSRSDLILMEQQKPLETCGESCPYCYFPTRLSLTPPPPIDLSISFMDMAPSSIAVLSSADIDQVKVELRKTVELLEYERASNSALLTRLQACMSNISVVCRIRPPTEKENVSPGEGSSHVIQAVGDSEVGVWDKKSGKWRSVALDRVHGPLSDQQSIFSHDVEGLVLSVLDGFSACIFCYGQTGSGKTYTMIGAPQEYEYGLCYRAFHKIFHVANHRASKRAMAASAWCQVKVAMLEIYNDDLRDLLLDGPQQSKLEIRMGQDGLVDVPGLTWTSVSGLKEAIACLEMGNANRAVGATNIHQLSSRSHSILMVEVTTLVDDNELSRVARLHLVDLAGSERVKDSGVSGDALVEAQHINSSLSALGDVMHALDTKQKHVPYRNSRLTWLLSDCLGGNSRTMMIVTVCPGETSLEESHFALQFATRVRSITLAPAQRHVAAKNLHTELKSLQRQLRDALAKKGAAEQALSGLQREHQRATQKLNGLLETRERSVASAHENTAARLESLTAQLEEQQKLRLRERSEKASLAAANEELSRQLKRSQARVEAQKLEVKRITARAEEVKASLQAQLRLQRKPSQSAFGLTASSDDTLLEPTHASEGRSQSRRGSKIQVPRASVSTAISDDSSSTGAKHADRAREAIRQHRLRMAKVRLRIAPSRAKA
jgi:kinesin family protein C2/C3